MSCNLRPGKYYIINRVTSFAGRPLALQCNEGENTTVTVTEFHEKNSQIWIVRDHHDKETQSVSPNNAPRLQIGMDDGVLKVLQARDCVWNIQKENELYMVQDKDRSVFWALERARNKEPVRLRKGDGDEKQNWVFIPVDRD